MAIGVHHKGEGGVPMPQSDYMELPAIGACLNCRSLFLVTLDTPNCILCGRLPTYTLPFAPARGGPVEPREEQPTPAEDLEDEEGIMAPPSTTPEESPEEEIPEALVFDEPLDTGDLIAMISMFLVGVPEGGDGLCALLIQSGADPEAAATAVGRLVAVRELITQLAQRQDPQPSAPDELVSPLAAAAAAAPSPESPPAPPEQDRTTVPSP